MQGASVLQCGLPQPPHPLPSALQPELRLNQAASEQDAGHQPELGVWAGRRGCGLWRWQRNAGD